MSNYNLSDNVQDEFNFELRDKKYSMRYPLTEEIEKVQEYMDKLTVAREQENNEEVEVINSKVESYLYSFISPVGHEMPIKDALAKENIRVMRNFNKMIKTELAIS